MIGTCANSRRRFFPQKTEETTKEKKEDEEKKEDGEQKEGDEQEDGEQKDDEGWVEVEKPDGKLLGLLERLTGSDTAPDKK